jgi:recombination protein RecA
MGDSHVGLQARLMSQALRKMTGNIKNSNTLVIFINQIRMKIGVMFGSPETTTGGNALKFYASVRLDIRRIGAVKGGRGSGGQRDPRQGGQEQGRAAVPADRVPDSLRPGHQPHGRSLDLGVQQGLVEKSGAWYAYKGDRIGQGRKNAADFLAANPQITEEIELELRRRLLPSARGHDEVVIPEPAQDAL